MALYDPDQTPAMPADLILAEVLADPRPAAAALRVPVSSVLNLARLAVYLRTLPDDYTRFGMASFSGDGAQPDQMGAHSCGTVACAVGHGPAAGIAPLPGETWELYADRCFGGPPEDRLTADANAVWLGLFMAGWRNVDDTARGAAARICYALQGGQPAVRELYRTLADGWSLFGTGKNPRVLALYSDLLA